MNEILANLLIIAIPFIKKLIESKVVPIIKRKAYERLDDFSNDRIEDLTELLISEDFGMINFHAKSMNEFLENCFPEG